MKRRRSKKTTMSRTQVLRRPGWTATHVDKLLGAPDGMKQKHGNRPDVPLYDTARVLEAEKSADFKKIKRSSAYRRHAGMKAVGTKVDQLIAEVESWPVEVERWPLVKLYAIVGNGVDASPRRTDAPLKRDPVTDRHAANYVLWNLTNIGDLKMRLSGRAGRVFAEAKLQEMARKLAVARYPELAFALRDRGFRRIVLVTPNDLPGHPKS